MGDDARPQGTAAPENDNIQEADKHGKENLHQILRQAHAAAVDQIDNMPQTERNAGHDHRPLDAVAGHSLEQKSAEDQLFQETDAEHLDDEANRTRGIVMHRRSAPEILTGEDNQRYVEQKRLCGSSRLAQAKLLQLVVLFQPEKQEQADSQGKHRRSRTIHTDTAGDLVKDGHAHAVDTDPCKGKT